MESERGRFSRSRDGEWGRGAARVVAALLLVLLAGCGGEEHQAPPSSTTRTPVAPRPPVEPSAPVNPLAGGAPAAAERPWRLAPLSPEASERVLHEVGAAAGVLIENVSTAGPAARAGVQAGDVLIVVAGQPVRSPHDVDVALRRSKGPVTLALLRTDAEDEWRIVQLTMKTDDAAAAEPETTSQGGDAAPPPPAPSAPPASTTVPAVTTASVPDTSVESCVQAYFDMLDFARAQAWGGRPHSPAAAVRDATAALRRSLPQIDERTRAAIRAIPAAWSHLREKWANASEAERRAQREVWRAQLVLPNPLLPAPRGSRTWDGRGGTVVFDYPSDWITATGSLEDSEMLFLAPAGTEASWQQVLRPALAPPGVLFVISDIDDELRAVPDVIAGARVVARAFVTGFAPGLREVAAFRIGSGAMVVLQGRLSGAGDESFCWVGSVPFGSGRYLAARFLAPVAQAERLLPIFSSLLASLEISPPDETRSAGVELAATMIGNAVVSAGWPD